MAQVTLQEIHKDLESLKQDISDLKSALLGDEGKLSPWAKERIEKYLKAGPRGLVSQAEMEFSY